MKRGNSGFVWLWVVLVLGLVFIGLLLSIFGSILFTIYYTVINSMVIDSSMATMLSAMMLVFTYLGLVILICGVAWVFVNSQRSDQQ